ncbi:MAG: 50S ribosomal protein L30 [Candidatus Saliniplasma sp.]
MVLAVIRIRSPRRKTHKIEETLKSLGLKQVNNCTIISNDPTNKGMLNRVKDVVTWGEIEEDMLVDLLKSRSNLGEELTDDYISENTEYETLNDFVKKVKEDNASIKDLPDLENLFKLHPPRGGFRGVKKPYKTGGSLGYRGKDINILIEKMFDEVTED